MKYRVCCMKFEIIKLEAKIRIICRWERVLQGLQGGGEKEEAYAYVFCTIKGICKWQRNKKHTYGREN